VADVLDIATLLAAAADEGSNSDQAFLTTPTVVCESALDAFCASQLSAVAAL